MSTENTSLKNTTPAGNSNASNKMVVRKINTYQRTFLIVASSLLALLVWITVTGKSGGRPFQSSTQEIAEGAGAFAAYQVDTANLVLAQDIFGVGAVSENDRGQCCNCCKPGCRGAGGCSDGCSFGCDSICRSC